MQKTIIVADDHPITAKGMVSILNDLNFKVISNHQNGINALNQIKLEKPDYCLLDVQMPGLCGIDILEKLKNKKLKTKVIIYTMFTDLSLFKRAEQLGVDGYLLKEFAIDDLKQCILSIESGKQWYSPKLLDKLSKTTITFIPELYSKLTSKEKQVLSAIAQDKSSKEIAQDQFISEKTVETHRRNIIKKLEIPKRKNALLIWAIEHKGFFSLMD